MAVISNLSVRPASHQPEQTSPQPLTIFILPDQTISEPFIPILVASILPEELALDFNLSQTLVFIEETFVPVFPLLDEPFFDQTSNSFVWLFFGYVDLTEMELQKETLELFAISNYEPLSPQTSPIFSSDQISVTISLPIQTEKQKQQKPSSQETPHESSSGKGGERDEDSLEGTGNERGTETASITSASASRTSQTSQSDQRTFSKDPDRARKEFEREVSERALSNAKKNSKSTAKGNGLVITVGAYPEVLPADGKSTAFIVAKVTDEKGKPVVGKEVNFSATGGQVLVRKAKTDEQGIALSRICSEKLPKGKKKIVIVKAKTNPEAETMVTFDGSASPLSTSVLPFLSGGGLNLLTPKVWFVQVTVISLLAFQA